MKKNKKVLVLSGLLVLAMIAGVLAYFNKTTTINNPFSTKSYGGETVEKFNPGEGEDWEPGATVEKLVTASNTGDYPLYVRVKFDETWTRKDESTAFIDIKANDAASEPLVNAKKILNVFQTNNADGVANVTVDDTVVAKNLVNIGGADAKWVDGGDGYFYYYKPLEPDNSTEALLESVTFAQDADMGLYGSVITYALCADPDKKLTTPPADAVWKSEAELLAGSGAATVADFMKLEQNKGMALFTKNTSALEAGLSGYADANYLLTITTDFVQTSADALAAAGWTLPAGVQ
ncbi:BsaA family SipW-dependent biofilm matrix protein [Diplocloster hominis]|uniref:BsaA family SipW-dependent biofilm matrix protein n=1 Tax=Diplocloster hominis TaxID=3079010 RepID=UPI0031BA539E